MSNDRMTEQLALQGGMKAVSTIEGKGKPKIGVDELMSIVERFGLSMDAQVQIRAIAESEDWGTGPFLANYYSGLPESKVQAYERISRELFESPFAIGVSSGTGALHSAFVAAGVGPGKEVIISAIGFYATAAAVVMAGGTPVFCDVDTSIGMDPDKIEALITERTVAISPTHVMGAVSQMDKIMNVARKHDLLVVEDCAQACGATFNGQLVGTIGDFGCFSIAAYKIVGGGEGGLVLCKTQKHWDRVNALAEGGGLWRPTRFAPSRYEGELFVGTNYRMSELEACVDVVQMQKMPDTVSRFQKAKQRIASQLQTFAEVTPQRRPDPAGEVGYVLRFFPESVELATTLTEALKAEGIPAGTRSGCDRDDWHIYHYMYPLKQKTQGCGPNCGSYDGDARKTYEKGACPVADDLFERMVSISINQWYTEHDCDQIAAGINKVLAAYCTPDSNGLPW